MLTYVTLNLVIMTVIFSLIFKWAGKAFFTKPVVYGLCGLVLLTAIFDNVIIASGIVAYDPAKIAGIKLYLAPIEDFSYAIVAGLFLPFLFQKFRGTS